MILLFQVFFVRGLSEDVDDRVKPDHVGEGARDKPEPSVQLWDVGDDIALRVFVILVIWIGAVFDVIGPAV